MKKMTRDLLNDANAIMNDAQNLKSIGAIADSMGKTRSFDQYFENNYTFDYDHDDVFGDFFTDEQAKIYDAYTKLVAVKLFELNH